MIVLFTDFGLHGPYTGQMKAVLHQMAPGIPTIDLFADAPAGKPKASAYLLAAYAPWFAPGTTFLCVVDPGVGGTRPPVMLEADGRWYVGPGNGLFELTRRRAAKRAASISTLSPSACPRAFTAATCLRRSQPCSRAASRHQAGRARMTRIAEETGRTTFPKSSMSTTSAMP
jgi:S-adenosyl-l-methionine hydroxide adenosyltransferase